MMEVVFIIVAILGLCGVITSIKTICIIGLVYAALHILNDIIEKCIKETLDKTIQVCYN